jgi:hypothetical protein
MLATVAPSSTGLAYRTGIIRHAIRWPFLAALSHRLEELDEDEPADDGREDDEEFGIQNDGEGVRYYVPREEWLRLDWAARKRAARDYLTTRARGSVPVELQRDWDVLRAGIRDLLRR